MLSFLSPLYGQELKDFFSLGKSLEYLPGVCKKESFLT